MNLPLRLCNKSLLTVFITLFILGVWTTFALAQIDIWTSAEELASIPMSGPAWDALLDGANQDCSNPDISDHNDNTNAYVLAAAIVYARTGEVNYKNKVVSACEKVVADGKPAGKTLAWARETGAYALAADLVGYRTLDFESWLFNMAEVYFAEDNRTMRQMFETRPNNWGAHAFGTLCAIYRYLGDTSALSEAREFWIQAVVGPNPGLKYRSDFSWHLDENNLRWINPKDAVKAGINIDGIIPDDMRRGGSLQEPPIHTNYAWGGLQGLVMAARILGRAGMSIWEVADSAVYRAAYALQVRYANLYGNEWQAEGDDEWMLPFFDEAYGTNWSNDQPRLWKHGKNAGWGYVTLVQSTSTQYTLSTEVDGSGMVTFEPAGGIYNEGTIITLTASPADGWKFDGWSGDLSGLTNPTTMTMEGNKNVTAIFTQSSPKPQFTLSVNTWGSGTVTLDPPGGVYDEGTTVDLIATPDAGWMFNGWSGDLTGSTNPTTMTIDSDKNITVNFVQTSSHTKVIELTPTDDSYVVSGKYKKDNYNGDSKLRMLDDKGWKNDHHMYLKFDLNGVSAPILSASLNLYCQGFSSNAEISASVYSVEADDWNESTITWESAPLAANLLDSQPDMQAVGETYTFNITDFVASELTGDKLITLMVRDTTETREAAAFGRRESSNPPTVTIVTSETGETTTMSMNKVNRKTEQNLDSLTESGVPEEYWLFQNYPNPFNPETEIRFQLPEATHVTLKVYNTLGQEVLTLIDSRYEPGIHRVRWDGKNKYGLTVASGTYFYRVQGDGFSDVKRMHLAK